MYQRNGHIDKFLFTASVLMYALATAVSGQMTRLPPINHLMFIPKHMGIVIFRAVTALVIAEEQPGGTMAFLH